MHALVAELRRDEIGELIVDTVDMFSNFFRGPTPATRENIQYQVLSANLYGRYETMILGTDLTDPPVWHARTWQTALRQHDAARALAAKLF